MAFSIAGSIGSGNSTSTGMPNQGHVWATTAGTWWIAYLTSTQGLALAYSTAPATSWSTPTNSPFTLTAAHVNAGRNFGFAYANIASTDILHMASSYYVSGTTSGSNYHARFTLGSTVTRTNAEAQLGSTNTSAAPVDGCVTLLDSTGRPIQLSAYNTVAGGDFTAIRGTNTDSGTSWTAGFGTPAAIDSSVSTSTESNFLASLGSGNMLAIGDNGATLGHLTNLTSSKWTSSWSAHASPLAGVVTSTTPEAWGAVARTTSDVHLVILQNNSNTYTHRRFNGTSWSAGDTFTSPPTYATTSGISLVSDGTYVWMAVFESSTGNLKVSKWTSGTGWGAFATQEASRTNTPSYLTGAYNSTTSQIMWAWIEAGGANYIIEGTLLSTASGTAYTLTTAKGTFTETGEAAGLAHGYVIAPAAGSFAETGIAAKFGYGLVAAKGTFAETGEAVTFPRTTHFTASAGSFAETGEPATFGYGLTASSGSFTEIGQSVSLVRATHLASAAGTFVETGKAASLLRTSHLATAAGTFVEAGQAAPLVRSVHLASAAGSFAETGSSVTMAVGHTLATAAGTFVETGEAASLLRASHVLAAAGTFVETGEAATLLRTGHLATAPGTFVETGIAAPMGFGRHLVSASGTFVETGIAAKFGYGLTASAGTFVETGINATLTFVHTGGHVLTTSPGSFVETGEPATLLRTSHLASASGSFAETGQSAQLVRSVHLATAAGTFVETGEPALMGTGHTLATTVGAFVETGKPATFGYGLTTASGSFVLTGEDATLTYGHTGGHTLTVSPGTFVETGEPATLLRTSTLQTSPGTFVETRIPAPLVWIVHLAASPGVFVETGKPASLLRSSTLTTSPGSFTLTGEPAGTAASRSLTAGRGTFLEAGKPSIATTARVLAAGTGSFSESGQAAGLSSGYTLATSPGVFTLTGEPTSILFHLTIVAQPGVFIETGSMADLSHNAAYGVIRVEWNYTVVDRKRKPTGFNVYATVGNSVDYSAPAAVVTNPPLFGGAYVHDLTDLLNEATYAIAVRAFNRFGESQNVDFVTAVADVIGPSAVLNLTATPST